ncbi:chromate efflux transporter [Nocardioides sp. CER19]|uniref:chromate efflux transporter n=1 Tax=Nocardioides sp. CER19 TaxID=3038538 RepID=UPI002446C0A2|nr:chromate efflux transporter [Nocardioides sp. CER19]MDH2412763.1 chromate efflux transporter [Nocardioides sp. CER19]
MPGLLTVLRSWGRIGCLGFGGPPAHIRLLRELCVDREGWIDAEEFEDAIATCNLLPGPSSTQLAIFTAWRVRGPAGAVVGGLAFIVPGLVAILALAALFLGGPPDWVLGAGAGAGAAVAAVAVHAGWGLTPASWGRRESTARWAVYAAAGAAAAALLGPWVVVVLLACGLVELIVRHPARDLSAVLPLAVAGGGTVGAGALLSLAWTSFKVGALSYGGGFVIIPLMQADAVAEHHWMSGSQFLNAVALGQVTPGPVVHTVAVVGYAAAGLVGGLLAAVVAFGPSFAFVLLGGRHFDRLRADRRAQAFLAGAGPAAIGAIYGSAVPLARELTDAWQYAVLAGAAVALFVLRRGVVAVLVTAAVVGTAVALAS